MVRVDSRTMELEAAVVVVVVDAVDVAAVVRGDVPG